MGGFPPDMNKSDMSSLIFVPPSGSLIGRLQLCGQIIMQYIGLEAAGLGTGPGGPVAAGGGLNGAGTGCELAVTATARDD